MSENRQSTQHGALRDDTMKKETEPLERSGGTSRTDEWREPEPLREEDEQPTEVPENDTHRAGGTPSGMDADDVRGRSELARWLQPSAFPADRERLLASAADTNAPDWVAERLGKLPDGTYQNVQDLWRALGGGTEDVEHRS
ncbi:MAG: DUF2795 domain-containing protein [Catenulispora sp.]